MTKTQPVLKKNCPILLTSRTQQHLVHKSLHHAPIHHNPLLAEASKVFTLIARLSSQTNTDSKKVQKLLSTELQNFEEKIKWFNYDENLTFVIHYALNICAEEIMHIYNTKKKSSNTSTLDDQKRFSNILEQMCKEPQKFIDVIELIYVCLNLRHKTQNSNPWQQTTDCVYQIIRSQRGEVEKRLSFLVPQATIRPFGSKSKPIFFPIFEVFLVTSFILFGMYLGTDHLFKLSSNQFLKNLQSIIKTAGTTVYQ